MGVSSQMIQWTVRMRQWLQEDPARNEAVFVLYGNYVAICTFTIQRQC